MYLPFGNFFLIHCLSCRLVWGLPFRMYAILHAIWTPPPLLACTTQWKCMGGLPPPPPHRCVRNKWKAPIEESAGSFLDHSRKATPTYKFVQCGSKSPKLLKLQPRVWSCCVQCTQSMGTDPGASDVENAGSTLKG